MAKKYCPKGGKVLDVGCGVGNVLRLIHHGDSTCELYGADIDETCLKNTKESVGLKEAIHISDVEDLFQQNRESTFDVVIFSHVLEHVSRPSDTVKGLVNLLKPGGVLILAVPNPVRPDVILFNLVQNLDKVNRGHIQTWDRAHWKNFLERILELDVVEYPTDSIRIPKLDEVK